MAPARRTALWLLLLVLGAPASAAVARVRPLTAASLPRALAAPAVRAGVLSLSAPLLAPGSPSQAAPAYIAELEARAQAPSAPQAQAARLVLAAAADPLVAGQVAAALGSDAPPALLSLARGELGPEARREAAGAAAELGLELDGFFDGGSGRFLADLDPEPPSFKSDAFIVPNERHPMDMRPILERAPAGVYVTVGTERGFMAAAMAPAVSHLVLADVNASAVAYNRTNAALLRLARDRREYLSLRFSRTRGRWTDLAAERAPELLPLLGDAGNFRDWRRFQGAPNLRAGRWARAVDAWHRFRRDHLGWTILPAPPGEEHRRPEFEGANYLRDDALFARVKSLADRGHIKSVQVDLGDGEAARGLSAALGRSGVPLSVLDLSNVWESAYLKARPVIRLVESFAAIARPESVLLASEGGTAALGYTGPSPWRYYGFRFSDVAGRVEEAARLIFGYNLRFYRPNVFNVPAPPAERPLPLQYDDQGYRTYWWTERNIEPR